MRPRKAERIQACLDYVMGIVLALIGVWLMSMGSARADAPGCVSQPWWANARVVTRTICDSPIQPDGSWVRKRSFTGPAFVANGAWYGYNMGNGASFGTIVPAREIPAVNESETYLVTPTTVLPDEPGHIG